MTRPEINRPLDQAEKDLLCRLAVAVIAKQTGADEQAAADALDTFAAEGQAVFRGDAKDAYLDVAGNNVVHAERDWLAFHAHADDWENAGE